MVELRVAIIDVLHIDKVGQTPYGQPYFKVNLIRIN